MEQEEKRVASSKLPLVIFSIAFVVFFLVVAVVAPLTWVRWPHTYLIKDATVEQVEQITQANPANRVWYDSASLLAEGSNLLEVTFRTRYLEKDNITEYLDSIGVQYSEIK